MIGIARNENASTTGWAKYSSCFLVNSLLDDVWCDSGGETEHPLSLANPGFEWEWMQWGGSPGASLYLELLNEFDWTGNPGIQQILHGLAIHEAHQHDWVMPQADTDRIAVPPDEVSAYLVGIEAQQDSEVVLRHIRYVLDVLIEKQEYELALACVAATQQVRPDDAGLYHAQGRVLSAPLEYDSSSKSFEIALALNPSDIPIRLDYARDLGILGEWQDVISVLAPVWDISGDLRAVEQLGIAHWMVGNLREAEQFLRLAHYANPNNGRIEQTLADLAASKSSE